MATPVPLATPTEDMSSAPGTSYALSPWDTVKERRLSEIECALLVCGLFRMPMLALFGGTVLLCGLADLLFRFLIAPGDFTSLLLAYQGILITAMGILWPALAEPLLRSKIAGLGDWPVMLRDRQGSTVIYFLIYGQLVLLLAGVVALRLEPAFAFGGGGNLQWLSYLAVWGIGAGAWWALGRRWWGPRTLRPGLWLLVLQLVGAVALALNPVPHTELRLAPELWFRTLALPEALQLLRNNWLAIPWMSAERVTFVSLLLRESLIAVALVIGYLWLSGRSQWERSAEN